MTPPRRDALEEARRRLDEAAGALDGIRRLTGADPRPAAVSQPGAPSAAEGVRREALAAARDDLRRMAADLEAERARGAVLLEEVGRLREELAARPKAHELTEARAAGELNASRRAAEMAQQVVGLKERVALLSAEHVRLEALRRKAEAFGADSEASRRSLEETMRRDLRAAHAALDRAAAESGTRDAKAVTEIEALRKRLDLTLARLHREDLDKAAADGALSSMRGDFEAAQTALASLRGDLEAANAVIASLRRELSEQLEETLGRERALALRAQELERRLTEALSPQDAALLKEVERLREDLAARPAAREFQEACNEVETLRRDLSAAHAALDRAAAESGKCQAQAASEIEEMRKRLDSALSRLHREDLRKSAADAAESLFKGDFEAAEVVIASLRRELSEQREGALRRERAFEEARGAEAKSFKGDLEAAHGVIALLRRQLSEQQAEAGRASAAATSFKSDLEAAQAVIASLRRELSEQLEETLGRERALEEARGAEASSFKGDLEAASAVIASLRRELSEQRKGALDRERAFEEARGAEAKSFKGDFEAASAVIVSLRRELSEQREGALGRERALELRVHELERRPPEAHFPPSPSAVIELDEGAVEYPPMAYALEPGWARLLRLVQPPLQAAYGHLRRLSAGPMSAGQRAILRLTGSSLSQAADFLATIDLALAEGPATTQAAPVLPVLESALAAWDAVFRRRAITLAREFSRILPDSPHDPQQLRLALHHVLRNAVEALPRGAKVSVHLSKNAAGTAAVLEFCDDGPGYPLAWLERQFEPFVSPRRGHAGLGLSAVRRALRRWGGDAEASNVAQGRGARLTLTFAATPDRPAAKS